MNRVFAARIPTPKSSLTVLARLAVPNVLSAASRLVILLLGMGIASSTALAQQNTSELPIDLKADSGEYDAAKGVATYTGNVVITQGQMHLKGDRVIIRLDGGEVVSLEAWGKLATFRYVPQNEPPIDGEGEYLKYTVATATVDIDKRARVTQGKNETRANRLSYNLDKEHVKGQGVHMTFTPKKKS